MTYSRRALFIAASLCLACVGGCGKASLDSQVVGHWQGKMDMGKDNPMANAINSMPAQTLDVKEDKTFTMSGGMEGSWDTAGEKLNLHWTKMMGMDKAQLKDMQDKMAQSNPAFKQTPEQQSQLDKPIVFAMAGDGKTMTSELPATQGTQAPVLTLTKSEAAK